MSSTWMKNVLTANIKQQKNFTQLFERHGQKFPVHICENSITSIVSLSVVTVLSEVKQ